MLQINYHLFIICYIKKPGMCLEIDGAHLLPKI